MRIIFVAASLLIAGCNPFGAIGNNSPSVARSSTTPVIAARGPGNVCTFTWDGANVSAEQITERATAMLRADIDRQGGPQNVDALPPVDLHVEPQLSAHCLLTALLAVVRSGTTETRIASTPDGGEPGAPITLHFAIDDGAPPPPIEPQRHTLRVDGVMLSWNGARIDQTRLRQYLEASGAIVPRPVLTIEITPTTPYTALAPVLATVVTTGSLPRFDLVEATGSDQPTTAVRVDLSFAQMREESTER